MARPGWHELFEKCDEIGDFAYAWKLSCDPVGELTEDAARVELHKRIAELDKIANEMDMTR